MSQPQSYPKFYATDSDGSPLSGGKLYTYNSGTLIPFATYSDADRTQPNTNPVVLDARGEAWVFPSSTGEYTYRLTDANDVQIWSKDGISYETSDLVVSAFKYMTPAQVADVQAKTYILDVTAAVQLALDNHKRVYFPSGGYKVTTSLLLNNGQVIYSDGSTNVTIKGNIVGALMKKPAGGTFVGISVDGITLDNTTSATAGGYGVDLTSINNSQFNNMVIRNCARGINGVTTNTVQFNNLALETCAVGVYNGIGCQNLTINGYRQTSTTLPFDIDNGALDTTLTGGYTSGVGVGSPVFRIGATAPVFGLRVDSIYIADGSVNTIGSGVGSMTWVNLRAYSPAVLVIPGSYRYTGVGSGIVYSDGGITWTSGTGAPEGVVSAPTGSLYTRIDGAPGATLYVKEASPTSNTGWGAK